MQRLYPLLLSVSFFSSYAAPTWAAGTPPTVDALDVTVEPNTAALAAELATHPAFVEAVAKRLLENSELASYMYSHPLLPHPAADPRTLAEHPAFVDSLLANNTFVGSLADVLRTARRVPQIEMKTLAKWIEDSDATLQKLSGIFSPHLSDAELREVFALTAQAMQRIPAAIMQESPRTLSSFCIIMARVLLGEKLWGQSYQNWRCAQCRTRHHLLAFALLSRLDDIRAKKMLLALLNRFLSSSELLAAAENSGLNKQSMIRERESLKQYIAKNPEPGSDYWRAFVNMAVSIIAAMDIPGLSAFVSTMRVNALKEELRQRST